MTDLRKQFQKRKKSFKHRQIFDMTKMDIIDPKQDIIQLWVNDYFELIPLVNIFEIIDNNYMNGNSIYIHKDSVVIHPK